MASKKFTETRQYRRVLAFVNRVRVEHNKRPLKQLPKGSCKDIDRCVIARAFHGPKGGQFHNITNKDGTISYIKFPDYVWNFIGRFDDGRIPELKA